MHKTYSISLRQLQFFILSAMIFATCEVLSIELNEYFNDISFLGFQFQLNVSVVFFCVSFFIIDLVTEIFDNHIADYFIYAKLISQTLFIFLGKFGVIVGNIPSGQLTDSFSIAPYVLLNSMIASLIGYKLTGKIMQYLKIKFQGRFLFSRYLSSTLPGEIIFSIIFTALSFSHGRSLAQVINIFSDLVIVKFILSFFFSMLIVPITNITRHYFDFNNPKDETKTMPFK